MRFKQKNMGGENGDIWIIGYVSVIGGCWKLKD